MAGSFSDFLELEVLDHVWGAAAYSAPGTIWFGLWAAALDDTSTGATAGEPTGYGYARKSLTNNLTNFPTAAAGAKANGAAVTGWSASGGNWGTISDIGCVDASSAGNMLGWCDATVPKPVNDGDTAEIAIGDFDVTLT